MWQKIVVIALFALINVGQISCSTAAQDNNGTVLASATKVENAPVFNSTTTADKNSPTTQLGTPALVGENALPVATTNTSTALNSTIESPPGNSSDAKIPPSSNNSTIIPIPSNPIPSNPIPSIPSIPPLPITTIAPNTISTTSKTNMSTTPPTPPTVPSTVPTTAAPPTSPTVPTTAIPSNITTAAPIIITTTAGPKPRTGRFDGPSFIGGIVLTIGLLAISFVSYKFFKARNDRNYHTF